MNVSQTYEQVARALRGKRFMLHNEKGLQTQLAALLRDQGLLDGQEVVLSPESIIDFMAPHGLGIEVKIAGSKKAIFRQCERYCQFDEVKGLLLVTNKVMGMPAAIDSKPIFVFNLGLAWF
jgi:hypothetical protein